MKHFDPDDYTVTFVACGRATKPIHMHELNTEGNGGGIVVLNGRAFAVEITDLGFVQATTEEPATPLAPWGDDIVARARAAGLHPFTPGSDPVLGNMQCGICGGTPGASSHNKPHRKPLEIDPISDFARSAMPHVFEPGEYVDSCKTCALTQEAAIHVVGDTGSEG